jgi:hypothetical protein
MGFVEDSFQMSLDGIGFDNQLLSDLFIRQPQCKEIEDLTLPVGHPLNFLMVWCVFQVSSTAQRKAARSKACFSIQAEIECSA